MWRFLSQSFFVLFMHAVYRESDHKIKTWTVFSFVGGHLSAVISLNEHFRFLKLFYNVKQIEDIRTDISTVSIRAIFQNSKYNEKYRCLGLNGQHF